MKPYTTNNGATGTPQTRHIAPLQKWNTGTVRVRNCAKSAKQMRVVNELEGVLDSFSRELGLEKLRNRATAQREARRANRK